MRVDKVKNGKATGKDEITGERVKDGCDKVMYWIWRLGDMTFESGVVPEDWRSDVLVSLYKSKGERTECMNYRGISLLSEVGKIFVGILVYRVRIVTGGLIDDEQGGFRTGKGCVGDLHTQAER